MRSDDHAVCDSGLGIFNDRCCTRLAAHVRPRDLLSLRDMKCRMRVFAVVYAFEKAVRNVVVQLQPDDSWMCLLPAKRQERIAKEFVEKRDYGFHPKLIDCTHLCDLKIVLRKNTELRKLIDPTWGHSWLRRFDAADRLRDCL